MDYKINADIVYACTYVYIIDKENTKFYVVYKLNMHASSTSYSYILTISRNYERNLFKILERILLKF